MGVYDLEKMQKLNAMYGKSLDECRFAGEIVLEENELSQLCKDIKYYSRHLQDKTLDNVLLVISINIAYYYYDENGFWVHFYELLDLNADFFNTAIVGNKIERVLHNKNLLGYKRVGPFRYVGALLEQIGITRYNIPIFAHITKELVDKYGIRKLMNLTNSRYSEIIEELYLGKFLKAYLKDRAGWEFYSYIFKTLFYIENGVLETDSIENTKGIHPMFWEEFLKYYRIRYAKQSKEKTTRQFYPVMMLDIFQRQIYIKFPQSKFNLKINNIQINSDSSVVHYLGNKEQLKSTYFGSLATKEMEKYEWQISGWDPDKTEHAYFNGRGEYIGQSDNLYEGNFYIITKSLDQKPGVEIVKFIGDFNVDGLRGYKIYKVLVKHMDKEKKSKRITLSWENTKNMLPIVCYPDVFQEKIPNIRIENMDLLVKNEAVLLYDIGDGIKRIRDFNELSELKSDIKNKGYVAGEIWSESFSINRNNGRNHSLKFCVLPKCRLQFPADLYAFNDKVQFISESSYISYKNCINNGNGTWVAGEGILNIEGNINFKDVTFSFNYPVNRVRVVADNTMQGYCNIDCACGNLMLKMYSVPTRRIDLLIDNGQDMKNLIDNLNVDHNGQYNIRIKNMENKLNEPNFSFGKLFLKYGSRSIDLSYGLLNLNNIIKNIENIVNDDERFNLLKAIDEKIAGKIMQISRINRNCIESITYIKSIDCIPSLDELYNTFIVMTNIFDGSIIKDEDGKTLEIDIEVVENMELLKTIKWFKSAIKAIKVSDKPLIKNLKDEYAGLLLPKLPRWNDKINKVYVELIYSVDTRKILNEWKFEVEKLKKHGLMSNISKRENGTTITCAWIDYLKGNYEKSIQSLGNIENTSDYIIDELKKVLQIIIYFKSVRLNAMKRLAGEYKGIIDEVGIVVDAYNSAYDIIFQKEIKLNNNLLESVDILPLKEEDKDFLTKLNHITESNYIEHYIEECECKRNWMTDYIYYEYLKNDSQYKTILKERLKSHIKEIPESAEKYNVFNELLK